MRRVRRKKKSKKWSVIAKALVIPAIGGIMMSLSRHGTDIAIPMLTKG